MKRSAIALAFALCASSALAQVSDVQLRPGSSAIWGAIQNRTGLAEVSQYNTSGSVVDSFMWYQGANPASATFLYSVSPTGAVFGAATGSRQGAGTINAQGLYVNGVAPLIGIGGTNGQIQYNNAGVLGGFTTSGDATINTGTGALTLATVNANVGSFGSATNCVTFTTNAKGLITAASAATCTPGIASVTGLGTGVATALATNVGSAGAPVLFNGAGGTPSSLTLTNATSLPLAQLTGAGTGVLAALAVNIGSAGAPVLFNGAGGTPSSMTGTNISSLNASNLSSGTVPSARGGAGTINGVLAGNGAGVVSQGTCAGLSGVAASCATDATNASNISSGTLAAARGGAGTVNGVLSGNGSGAVSQGATSGLTDVTTDTSWTPIDASGAGLSFTVLGARYNKVGKIVVAWFRLTYPATGSGATASVGGLPVAASANYPASNTASGTCFSSAGSNSNMTTGIVASATAITFFNNGGAANLTNTNLTGLVVSCVLTYVST